MTPPTRPGRGDVREQIAAQARVIAALGAALAEALKLSRDTGVPVSLIEETPESALAADVPQRAHDRSAFHLAAEAAEAIALRESVKADRLDDASQHGFSMDSEKHREASKVAHECAKAIMALSTPAPRREA